MAAADPQNHTNRDDVAGVEAEHAAALAAARQRLAEVEARLAGQPAPTPTPVATPQPIAQPTTPPASNPGSFDLKRLHNPDIKPLAPLPVQAAEPIIDPAAPVAPAPATPPPVPTSAPATHAMNPKAAPSPAPSTDPDIAAIVRNHASVSPLAQAAAAKASQQAATAPPPKPKPSMPSRLRPLLSAVVVFLFVMALFKAPVFYYQLKYSLERPSATTNSTSTTNTVATQPTLYIPKINVRAPINFEPSIDEANVQKALETGVVHYGNTASPGEVGNTVIFGHSSNDWDRPGDYKFIFVLLEKLSVGDTFSIDYGGKRYEYQIYNRQIILPTDVHVVGPTAEPVATLITCWPVGTSTKRLIVQAKQTSPAPSADSTAVAATTNTQAHYLPGTKSNSGISGTVNTWLEQAQEALRGDAIEVNGS